jgi:short-subunit dehydrogenase
MKSAIVTGSSSGIGQEITKKLLSIGYKVYGISRNTAKSLQDQENFVMINYDLTNTKKLPELLNPLLKADPNLSLLVNNAGVGAMGPHEELNYQNLDSMMILNFVVPILLTRLCLRELKKNVGHIISISSASAQKPSPMGAAYSATKAGLTHFGESLFEEVRKAGVKVTTIHPDITQTNFFTNLTFKEYEEEPSTYILPETIANFIEYLLQFPETNLFTNVTIKPQRHRLEKKKEKLSDDPNL